MSPLLALLALHSEGPLDRLVGNWTSLEQVDTPLGKKELHLKGTNRWVFKNKLLEIREKYTVAGDPAPGENHILLRALEGARVAAWWFVPDAAEPLIFDGSYDAEGMTLTRKDGRMRIVYQWDGPKAYDAKLQTRRTVDESWADRTIARYTKKG